MLWKFSKFIYFLGAVIDLSDNPSAISENKVNIVTIFHNNFNKFFELIFIFWKHNTLAIVHHNENFFLMDFFYYFLSIVCMSVIQLTRLIVKQLHGKCIIDFSHFLEWSYVEINNTIFKYISELDKTNEFSSKCAFAHAGTSNNSDESILQLDKFENTMQIHRSWDEILHPAG